MIDFTIDVSNRNSKEHKDMYCVRLCIWHTIKHRKDRIIILVGRSDYGRRCGGSNLFIRSQYKEKKNNFKSIK